MPGLSIRLPDGRWFDAPSIDGAFTVNGGDLLKRNLLHRFGKQVRIDLATLPAVAGRASAVA